MAGGRVRTDAYQRRRTVLCLSVCVLFIAAVEKAAMCSSLPGSALTLALAPIMIYTSLSARYPQDCPRHISALVLFVACAVIGHLALVEWQPWKSESASQTLLRQVAICVENSVCVALVSLYAMGRVSNTWFVFRGISLSFGGLELVHTLCLTFLSVSWPEQHPPGSQLEYFSCARRGPPSVARYLLSAWYCAVPLLCTLPNRCFIARWTGGEDVAMDLGQLSSNEFERLAAGSTRCIHSDSGTSRSVGGQQPAPSEAYSWSWGSYGQRWEEEWQQQRERELEGEREQWIAEYLASRAIESGDKGETGSDQSSFSSRQSTDSPTTTPRGLRRTRVSRATGRGGAARLAGSPLSQRAAR